LFGGQEVSLLSVYGFIRFDVEDFLTPESDEALVSMMASMRRYDLPGWYGLVGKKVEALAARERRQALTWLKEEPNLGFHSTSHSEHPTIAEELAPLEYETALKAFMAREEVGVTVLERHIRAPEYFTQPGANWVPEALEALPRLGMDVFFSDGWNSYLKELHQPYWYGDVLHLSFPVENPRPFGLALPDAGEEAVAMIEAAAGRPDGSCFMVMLHPTELATTVFWDAVNFSHGTTRQPLVPAPLREPENRDAALKAFDVYLSRIARIPGITWMSLADVRHRVATAHGGTLVLRRELIGELARRGLGPLRLSTGTVSAAEALYALAYFTVSPELSVRVPRVRAPESWHLTESGSGQLSATHIRSLATKIVETGNRAARLPSTDDLDVPLEWVAQHLYQYLRSGRETLPLTFLSYLKPVTELHWDWPIFPPDFQPMRLWHDARRQLWSLKPARW